MRLILDWIGLEEVTFLGRDPTAPASIDQVYNQGVL